VLWGFYWLIYSSVSQASFVRAYNTQHHINQTFGIYFDYHKTLKKPTDDTSPRATKAPVRRTDPSKRDRTVAPKPIVRPQAEPAAERIEIRAPVHAENPQSKASQRNHRYDGRLRDEAPRPQKSRPTLDDTGRDTPRRGGKMRDGFEVGDFNNDRANNPMFTPKPLPSNPDFPRLSKRMAELGFCSRREADEWITNGWVKVDGRIVDELGSRVAMNAKIEVSKDAEKHQSEIVTIILNKRSATFLVKQKMVTIPRLC